MNLKTILLGLAFGTLSLSAFNCRKNANSTTGNCYKGKLVVKGICMNYTISVTAGTVDPSRVEASWKDPNTGTTYTNAFRLGSPCNFPSNIAEGDEFYFRINDTAGQACAVCKAYYPTPGKALAIEVLNAPCP